MDEARKAIPLRRKQAGGPAARQSTAATSWRSRASQAVRLLGEPPRQLWLATLGSTAITVRGALATWELLVSEGRATERWLLGPRAGG
jgi:hypothetical protein